MAGILLGSIFPFIVYSASALREKVVWGMGLKSERIIYCLNVQ